MVAVIHSGSSLRRALNYNEQKVQQEAAVCIAAVNYPKDAEDLKFHQKLNRLQNQAALNVRTRVNSVHISLNFDPSEKFSTEKLKEISYEYLQKIGFANQPYLLYQHNDSGHPHVHIVTTNIKSDGKRIELHNLGKNQSEKARKEIEILHSLVKAEDIKKQPYKLKAISLQKVQYGKLDSRRAIAKVLEGVLNNYRYTSLHELNVVLKQYNVYADKGTEQSRTYQHKGLLYHILDEKGGKIGVPIKASSFYDKPTLKSIEEKFASNEAARQPFKSRVKNAIDLALLKNKNHTVDTLITSLVKEGIHTVLRQNSEGLNYGITYVDHKTKCVFNGSDLGKQYSAKGILERCDKSVLVEQKSMPLTPEKQQPFTIQTAGQTTRQTDQQNITIQPRGRVEAGLLETLLQPENSSSNIPYPLSGKGRKKKKKSKSKHL